MKTAQDKIEATARMMKSLLNRREKHEQRFMEGKMSWFTFLRKVVEINTEFKKCKDHIEKLKAI